MADERTYIMIKCVSLSEIREIAMTRPDHPSHRSIDRSIDRSTGHSFIIHSMRMMGRGVDRMRA